MAHSREIVVDNENNKSNDGENGHNGRFSDGNTNIYDDEEDEEEEEDDEEEEDEEDDEDKIAEQMADMDICDDEEEEDDDDELDNYDIEYDEEDDIQGSRENSQEKSLKSIRERISPSMGLEDDDEEEEEEDEDDDDEALDDLISSEKCDCFHCKRQAQNEQKVKIILYFLIFFFYNYPDVHARFIQTCFVLNFYVLISLLFRSLIISDKTRGEFL